MGKFVNNQTLVGPSIRADQVEIYPLVKRTCIQPPGYRWALSWQRPKAVVVEESNGNQVILPVEDHTRRIQVILVGLGLLGSLLIWLAFREW